jgi:hypothetical protein
MRHLVRALSLALALAAITAPSAVADTVSAAADGPPPGMEQAKRVDAPPVGTLAGSFNWTASLRYRLYSRVWYQNAGNTTIYSYMDCSGDPYISGYVIRLSGRESVWYGCNGWYVYSWGGVGPGYKQFVITKANDGRYINGRGTTYYP